jgi:WD40 repeat protein
VHWRLKVEFKQKIIVCNVLWQQCFTASRVSAAGHKNAVLELHWTSDGERIVSASPDKSVRAWDAVTGEQVKKMAEHDNFVNSCCPLKRGPPLLVSGSDDGTAKVWRPDLFLGSVDVGPTVPINGSLTIAECCLLWSSALSGQNICP